MINDDDSHPSEQKILSQSRPERSTEGGRHHPPKDRSTVWWTFAVEWQNWACPKKKKEKEKNRWEKEKKHKEEANLRCHHQNPKGERKRALQVPGRLWEQGKTVALQAPFSPAHWTEQERPAMPGARWLQYPQKWTVPKVPSLWASWGLQPRDPCSARLTKVVKDEDEIKIIKIKGAKGGSKSPVTLADMVDTAEGMDDWVDTLTLSWEGSYF